MHSWTPHSAKSETSAANPRVPGHVAQNLAASLSYPQMEQQSGSPEPPELKDARTHSLQLPVTKLKPLPPGSYKSAKSVARSESRADHRKAGSRIFPVEGSPSPEPKDQRRGSRANSFVQASINPNDGAKLATPSIAEARRNWALPDSPGLARAASHVGSIFHNAMHQPLQMQFRQDLSKKKKDRAEYLRTIHFHNIKLQGEEEIFKRIANCPLKPVAPPELPQKAGGSEHEDSKETQKYKVELAKYEDIAEQFEHYIIKNLRRDSDFLLKPGPVGDLPIHNAFLLGRHDLGMRIYRLMVDGPEGVLNDKEQRQVISMPYHNDILHHFQATKGADEAGEPLFDDGGLFTGETVLHIAIVQNDREAVNWLMECGAYLCEETTGVFFQPKRVRITKKSMIQISKFEVNEHSGVYYGGLPLSFAASLGEVEICKLLLKQAVKVIRQDNGAISKDETLSRLFHNHEQNPDVGIWVKSDGVLDELKGLISEYHVAAEVEEEASDAAEQHSSTAAYQLALFMNARDVHLNTALHMAVSNSQFHTVDWLVENGAKASLNMLNENHLTPVTLAVRHGQVDMFQHILLSHMTIVPWSYGPVEMRNTSLEQVDSFRIRDKKTHVGKWRSALEVAVRHEIDEFALFPLFERLIQDKWDRFGKRYHLTHTVLPYVAQLVFFSLSLHLRCSSLRDETREKVQYGNEVGYTDVQIQEAIETVGTSLGGNFQELVIVICTLLFVPYLLIRAWRDRRLNAVDFDPDQDMAISTQELMMFVYKNNEPLCNLGISCLLVAAFVFRMMEQVSLELETYSLASVLLYGNLLNLLFPFKFFGMLLISIHHMLVGDVFTFLMVFLILLVGFSQATFVLLQKSSLTRWSVDNTELYAATCEHCDSDWTVIFFREFMVAMGEVDLNDTILASSNPTLLFLLHFVFIVVFAVLLLNLLIALMGQTFEKDNESGHRTWWQLFASLVLRHVKWPAILQMSTLSP